MLVNITPHHFSTASGDPVLEIDSDGRPHPIVSPDSRANHRPHEGLIALAIYENAWALSNDELDQVAEWITQYKRKV